MLVPNQMAPLNSSPKRGGKRVNAGRKRSEAFKYDPWHATRPELSFAHPAHVMLRTLPSVPRLRQRDGYEAIRSVLLYFLGGSAFRIVHISIQRNHLHMIVEATNKDALRRGMQSFAIRAARVLNAAFEREGKVFAFRYKAKQVTSADYARNVLAYVLKNASHCTFSGRRVELPTSWAETRLLRDAQSALKYRRPSFEDFVLNRTPAVTLAEKIDFQIRNGPGAPQQLHS